MKKIVLTLIAIIAVNSLVSAQIRFGVKGGLNLANVSVTPTIPKGTTMSNLIGFHGGIILDVPLSEKISIQPNLLFSQKGIKSTSSNSTILLDSKIALNYIEIPINVMFHATDALSIGGGSYLGYVLSGVSTSTVTFSGKTETMTKDADFDRDLKRLDFGLNITAGYEVSNGLIINANYSLGLGNISAEPATTVKNNVISFSLTKFFGQK